MTEKPEYTDEIKFKDFMLIMKYARKGEPYAIDRIQRLSGELLLPEWLVNQIVNMSKNYPESLGEINHSTPRQT